MTGRLFEEGEGGAERRHLRIIGSRSVRATATESSGPLPGDGLIPEPLDSLTHAITINRCAADVWPWLAQMGAGMSWAFVLIDGMGGSCRLIVRARVAAGYEFHGLPWWMTSRVGAAVHFVMQRKQLLGIKKRAESKASDAVVAPGLPRTVHNNAA